MELEVILFIKKSMFILKKQSKNQISNQIYVKSYKKVKQTHQNKQNSNSLNLFQISNKEF